MKNSKIFMAFSKGTESTEGASINRYIGVAPVTVEGFNPTKEELEKFYNTTLDNDPEYIGEMENNGEKVKFARVTFIVKPDPKEVGMDISPISLTFFIRNEYKFNNDKTKIRVIDEYGNAGWATKEQMQNHVQLLSKAGKALKISTNYRPAFVGEIELTNFIKAFLNIPEVFEYVEGNWKLKKDADLGVARFEHIENLFKGDFSEVKEVIAYQPDNKVKVLFGVRKNDEGKMYQSFFKEMFLKNSVTDYSKLDKEVQDRKNSGAYPTTDFEVGKFKIYTVDATNLAEAPADPFAQKEAPANPWFNA